MCGENYFEEQRKRVKKLYVQKHVGFGGAVAMADWYVARLKKQECRCYYCETSIDDINRLIAATLLKTRSVRGDGKRGPVLELTNRRTAIALRNVYWHVITVTTTKVIPAVRKITKNILDQHESNILIH